MAAKRIMQEIKEHNKNINYHYSISVTEDIFKWNFIIVGPEETLYENGLFSGSIDFPSSYPNKPPNVRFNSNIFHPNIYTNGQVCISILHEGSDQYGYETVSERWSPSQSVNTIMLSIISLLSEPNLESPANLNASKMFKEDYEKYKKTIYKTVALSQDNYHY